MIATTNRSDSVPQVNQFEKKRLLAILFITWLALFAGINTIPLEDHDAFVLQTAREMGMKNDWILPYFCGEPRLNKPPLNYWLTLGISRLDPFATDIEPWHGRAPSMIGGLLLVLMTARQNTLPRFNSFDHSLPIVSGLKQDVVSGHDGISRITSHCPDHASDCAFITTSRPRLFGICLNSALR